MNTLLLSGSGRFAPPADWSPAAAQFDLRSPSGSKHYWAAVGYYAAAYEQRISREVSVHGPLPIPVGPAVPLWDLALSDSGLELSGQPEAWLAHKPVANDGAQFRLPRGTLLEAEGMAGDPTQGLEVQVWRLVNGPIQGRGRIHTALGPRFGAEGTLTRCLLVDPEQPLVRDLARTEALMIDLARLATDLVVPALPT
jgi:hypothetical protein